MSEQVPENEERDQPEADEVRREAGGGSTVAPRPDGQDQTEDQDHNQDQVEGGDHDPRDVESDEERRQREEEFAREHDPADHDVAAGEEFRQPGDWVGEGDDAQELTTEQPSRVATGGAGEGQGGQDAQGEGGEEIRDGGHGWGSAAPISGGGTPEGHPVKAWHDTMTFVLPDEPGYDAEPHECFVDAETAQRAGFRHAHS